MYKRYKSGKRGYNFFHVVFNEKSINLKVWEKVPASLESEEKYILLNILDDWNDYKAT